MPVMNNTKNIFKVKRYGATDYIRTYLPFIRHKAQEAVQDVGSFIVYTINVIDRERGL